MASDVSRGQGRATRVVVGLGNAERERRLVPGLIETGEIAVVGRCLAADQLLETLQSDAADVALVALDLHRLNDSTLSALAATGVPLVGLAARSDDVPSGPPWRAVLPPDVAAEQALAALVAAASGLVQEIARPQALEDIEAALGAPTGSDELASTGTLVIASGKGSPGCTTVAVNLAAALGAVESTVLVDLDLAGPSVAAFLGLDPTRNLYMLAHAEPKSSREWTKALDQETQPLARRSPHGLVLAGIPKPEMRAAISLRFLQRLVAELQERFRHVVLDVGSVAAPSIDAGAQSWLLGGTGQLLMVSTGNLTGVWRARTALARVPELQGGTVGLVINQHDRRTQHTRAEIEWALGRTTSAIIPSDHRSVELALVAQQPVIFRRRSHAGHGLLAFAERIHGGQIMLPPEIEKPRRTLGRLTLPKLRRGWPPVVRVAAPTTSEEVTDGNRAAIV